MTATGGPGRPSHGTSPSESGRVASREIPCELEGEAHKRTFKGTDEELEQIAAWLAELKPAE